MNPEEKKLLERVAVLSEENNQILRGIRRANRWGAVVKAFYWVIIIGISYGTFVYIQPYFDKIMGTYQNLQGQVESVGKVGDSIKNFEITSLLKK
jgi:hypothetical protein